MKKKVAIAIITILVMILVVGGALLLKKENVEVNNPASGDVSGENVTTNDVVLEEIARVEQLMKDKPLDYFNEEVMVELPQRAGTSEMSEYAEVQSFKLDEIDTKNYKWICTIENPENISIDSGETVFLYTEHGVGTAVDRIYKVTGLKEGETIIKMDCTFDTPMGEHIKQETVVYKVSVNSDKQVAISESLRYQFKEMGYLPEFDYNYQNIHEH